MISPTIAEEIRRLLQGGNLSQRAIARQTGVSRGTVQAYREGKRLPRGGCRLAKLWSDFTPPGGSPAHCPRCGTKVQMPCLACYLRQSRKQGNGNSE